MAEVRARRSLLRQQRLAEREESGTDFSLFGWTTEQTEACSTRFRRFGRKLRRVPVDASADGVSVRAGVWRVCRRAGNQSRKVARTRLDRSVADFWFDAGGGVFLSGDC